MRSRGRQRSRLSFSGRALATRFERRRLVLAPGAGRGRDDLWPEALVVVERGEIRVETWSGAGATFVAGDVLCVAPLGLRRLHNRGPATAVVGLVRRRPVGQTPPDARRHPA